jgi:hypothetical protein
VSDLCTFCDRESFEEIVRCERRQQGKCYFTYQSHTEPFPRVVMQSQSTGQTFWFRLDESGQNLAGRIDLSRWTYVDLSRYAPLSALPFPPSWGPLVETLWKMRSPLEGVRDAVLAATLALFGNRSARLFRVGAELSESEAARGRLLSSNGTSGQNVWPVVMPGQSRQTASLNALESRLLAGVRERRETWAAQLWPDLFPPGAILMQELWGPLFKLPYRELIEEMLDTLERHAGTSRRRREEIPPHPPQRNAALRLTVESVRAALTQFEIHAGPLHQTLQKVSMAALTLPDPA